MPSEGYNKVLENHAKTKDDKLYKKRKRKCIFRMLLINILITKILYNITSYF